MMRSGILNARAVPRLHAWGLYALDVQQDGTTVVDSPGAALNVLAAPEVPTSPAMCDFQAVRFSAF